ncbi:MAG: hypothetical protein E4H13_05715 [Calditrichales bacterium]|nr:MAG: hypothetical protein E4H13_05715 [Calditrichales bacterium]
MMILLRNSLTSLILLGGLLLISDASAQIYVISGITFRGLHKYSEDDIRNLLHTEEGVELDARLIKLDKILLTNFYRQNGYLNFTVSDSLDIDKLTLTARVRYILSEGQRYYFGRSRISGNHDISQANILKCFDNLKPDSPFDEGQVKIAGQTLESLYFDSGKPYAKIKFDYEFEHDSLIILTCDIIEKQTVKIVDMEYLGLDLVKPFVVYRELELKRGDPYSRHKLARSNKNLYQTGLFEYVRFEIKPVSNDSARAVLQIHVLEKDPRWIGASIGFTHEDEESYGNKLELSLEGGHRNLFGTGRSLSLYVVPSFFLDFSNQKMLNPDNHITLVFVEPWIGYSRTPGILTSSYHLYRPLNSAHFNVLRFNFGISREISDLVELRGALETKLVRTIGNGVIDSTLADDTDRDQIYSVSLYGKRDTRNNFFNPENGSLTDANLSYSYSVGRLDNGETDIKTYFTLISSWRRFQPINWRWLKKRSDITFSNRVKGGALLEVGPTKTIPISDLFFAGGATTVRGYQEQMLGPTTFDENGFKDKALGGKMLLVANAELRFPLWWLFVGEVFVDAGNVWREIEEFNPSEIRFSTGLGLVLLTPVGPIRFDYGIKLNKEASDKTRAAFHFGLYFAF